MIDTDAHQNPDSYEASVLWSASRTTMQGPHPLAGIVTRVTYRPGWAVKLRSDPGGWTLQILALAEDSDNPNLVYPADMFSPTRPPRWTAPERVFVHERPVPTSPPGMTTEWWVRWLFDQLVAVERHEAREYFRVDGERAYQPAHFGKEDRFGSTDPWADVPWPAG